MPALPIVPILIGAAVLVVLLVVFVVFTTISSWRRVVPTNMVHIVQTKKKTTSYGANKTAGNVYYAVPASIPVWGKTVIELPVSNFDEPITGYKAYDMDRVPFEVDLVAFFRIVDTDKAAERISSFADLKKQLLAVVQGAVRKVLASHDIHKIMTERATFGTQFTDEVRAELAAWGVEPVKSLELMDVRDSDGSKIISAIQAEKSSAIDMQSRKSVAENRQKAQMAEIENQQLVDLRKVEAERTVGQQRAEQTRLVGIADEQAKQAVQEEASKTKTKEMAVLEIDTQRRAEIDKRAGITRAEQEKQTAILKAEAKAEAARREKEATVAAAQGEADAIKAKGEATAAVTKAAGTANADAAKALEMAKVTPQLELANGIGANKDYQDYMVRQRTVEANEKIGVAQAAALAEADIKIIANGGDVTSGIGSISQLLSSKGGTALGAMLEGLSNTETGKALVNKLAASEVAK